MRAGLLVTLLITAIGCGASRPEPVQPHETEPDVQAEPRSEEEIAAQIRRCTATCDQRELGCANRCRGDDSCQGNCRALYIACEESCSVEAESERGD